MRPSYGGYDTDDYSISSSLALSTSALSRQESFVGWARKNAGGNNPGRSSPERRSVSAPRPQQSQPQHSQQQQQQQQSANKTGRVKVGIRCRPAFQDEVDFAKGQYMDIVTCQQIYADPHELQQQQSEASAQHAPSISPVTHAQVTLTLISGKPRDFVYDYAFGPDAQQEEVFDLIARPVVTEVLRGYNGTIFAYGQTGTGKTYTMGILQAVNSEHAGIVPRALSQVFEYCNAAVAASSHGPPEHRVEISVSLSFLQIYCETIQGNTHY